MGVCSSVLGSEADLWIRLRLLAQPNCQLLGGAHKLEWGLCGFAEEESHGVCGLAVGGGGMVKWGFRETQLAPGSSYRSGDDMQCYWGSVQHNKARGVCCAVMSKEGLVSWVPSPLYPALARSRPSLIGRHILAYHSPKLWFTCTYCQPQQRSRAFSFSLNVQHHLWIPVVTGHTCKTSRRWVRR